MQMVRANQTNNFWNKRTTFGGTPLFPFQPVGEEITVPFALVFRFYFVLWVLRTFFDLPMGLQAWNNNKNAFPFDTERFRNFQLQSAYGPFDK